MSYDIYIGEAEISDEDGRIETIVRGIEDPKAPTFPGDEFTGRTNGRHPAYSGWDEFTRAVGLHALFFDKEEGIMREHPGIARLTPGHLTEVRAALKTHQAKRWARDRVPGFGDESKWDPNQARLIWLEFWIARALATCKVPSLHNH